MNFQENGEDQLPIFSSFLGQPPLVPSQATWTPIIPRNNEKAFLNDGCWRINVTFPAETKPGLLLKSSSCIIDTLDDGASDVTSDHNRNGYIAQEDEIAAIDGKYDIKPAMTRKLLREQQSNTEAMTITIYRYLARNGGECAATSGPEAAAAYAAAAAASEAASSTRRSSRRGRHEEDNTSDNAAKVARSTLAASPSLSSSSSSYSSSATTALAATFESALFVPKLRGKTIVVFVDFSFEDMEVMYPKIRLEEEGAKVVIVGGHPAGTKYTGKYGYPIKSDSCVDDLDISEADALILPGGFAPDYMRRNTKMLQSVVAMVEAGKPCAAICHGPWMFCSARAEPSGPPIVAGRRATSFVAIKDDLVNAGATYVDEAVVVDGPFITSRTPDDLTPFVHAIIASLL